PWRRWTAGSTARSASSHPRGRGDGASRRQPLTPPRIPPPRTRQGGAALPYAAEAPRTIELSVAAPAYNEAENIAGVVREWRDYLIRHPAIGRWEIVVCDDGSTDATG